MNDPKRRGEDGWEEQKRDDQAKAEAAIAAYNRLGREDVDGWDTTKGGTQAKTPGEGERQL
jgi:hypothetical protein